MGVLWGDLQAQEGGAREAVPDRLPEPCGAQAWGEVGDPGRLSKERRHREEGDGKGNTLSCEPGWLLKTRFPRQRGWIRGLPGVY